MIADLCVYRIRKVDDGRACRECDNIALRREYIHIVGCKIDLDRVGKLVDIVGILLLFENVSYPVEALFAGHVSGYSRFVLPVCGDTVLCGVVHLIGAYLHLKRYAFPPYNGCVERLVAVWLRGCDIILEAVGNGLEDIVDDTENVVALYDSLHDNADCVDIVYLVEALALYIYLFIYAVHALDSALDSRRRLDIAYTFSYTLLDYVDERIALLLVLVEHFFDSL